LPQIAVPGEGPVTAERLFGYDRPLHFEIGFGGGELRFGTDHPVYLRHALMVMRRHRGSFAWLADNPSDFRNRPGGWPETRYEAKARADGHEVWYFRYRRR
jgi:tRNA G46 methylase TrmB